MTAPDRQRPPGGGLFVLVAGWPGAGKSTLAAALAARLGLPLLATSMPNEVTRSCGVSARQHPGSAR